MIGTVNQSAVPFLHKYHLCGIIEISKLINLNLLEASQMYRTGTIDDCKDIYELVCELESKQLSFRRFSEIYQKQIGSSCYYCVVCEHDNHIVGFLNLRYEEQLHHANYIAEILEFVVRSSHRNSGIGKEMFAFACDQAKKFGCIQIEVACNQLRKDAHRFYERQGMRNSHFKFSKSLTGEDMLENTIDR